VIGIPQGRRRIARLKVALAHRPGPRPLGEAQDHRHHA